MSVAEKFTISDETAKGLGSVLAEGSFKIRIFAYILIYIPFFVFSVISISLLSDRSDIAGGVLWTIIFALPFIPIYLIEKMIRRRRRRDGLPIYESIDKILKQRAIDERVAMEAKAQEKVNLSKDLNYYFDLLQKGAITQEEYEAKKQHFL